ncbi:MAG: glycosyltransferase family 2 protein [Lachnospiraceae bacterium]|nr:glycosyltransferase family 2 protein [Lachnospiraceae bacterium]
MKTVTIIVPCFNEAEVLPEFYRETRAVTDAAQGYDFSFLFVDDGSRDATLSILRTLQAENKDAGYLSFSRNFGKEAAMYAGLSRAKGDYVIVMDADLQHPPALIPQMLEGIEEGYDCCAAYRVSRKGEARIRSLFSSAFYHLSNRLSDVKMKQGAVDFRIMSRRMVDAILQLSEVERFSKGIFAWVGYETKWIPYENVERTLGKTKWTFGGLLRYALAGITSFSVTPLRMITWTGFIISVLAFLYIVVTIVQTLIFGIDVPGYVTTLCAILFLGGLVELSVGILGEYLSHLYLEAKRRPIYLLKEEAAPAGDEDAAEDH